jgi:ribosome-associated protein
MEDMLSETNTDLVGKQAAAVSELLKEHKGQDVCVLDLRGINDWLDFFVIATVISNAHMDGLERHIMDYCRENKIDVLGKSRKSDTGDDEWRLIDLGSMFIHLMTKPSRDFYDLERLWRKSGRGQGTGDCC